MEGGSHGHGFDPAIKDENAGVNLKHKGGKSDCIGSSGWTDEKHINYLSSVEQSFVDELSNKYCEELVDGLPRKSKVSRISTDSELFLGKFLEKHTKKVRKEKIPNWIWRSQNAQKFASYMMEEFEMFSKGGLKVVNIGNSKKENDTNEGLYNEKTLLSNPWIQRWISPDDRKLRDREPRLAVSEMSDQNFLDEEIGVVESNMVSEKRSRSPIGSEI